MDGDPDRGPPPRPSGGASRVVGTEMTFRWVSPKEGGAEKGLISHLIFLEGVANAAADSRSLLGSPGKLIIGVPCGETILWSGLILLGSLQADGSAPCRENQEPGLGAAAQCVQDDGQLSSELCTSVPHPTPTHGDPLGLLHMR